jgi:cation:H+ antiporter
MTLTLLLLVAAAGAIYAACGAFTNGVEWLGRKLRLGDTATGTILAAFGTALPESVVTLVATAFAERPAQKAIGIGAALGGPLVLATIAYAVVGIGMMLDRRRPALAAPDVRRLGRDQIAFLAIFVVKISLGLVAFAVKPILGFAFLAAYGWYLASELRRPAEDAADLPEPLKIRPAAADPAMGWVLLQTLAAAAVVFAASRLFVDQLEAIGPWLGLSPQVTALLLSPIATEMPETVNALIWVRQGKDRLALANISGAMMIQATIPTAFGLFFTPWLLDRALLAAAAVTAAAIAFLYLSFRRGGTNAMLWSQVGWGYLLFAGAILVIG